MTPGSLGPCMALSVDAEPGGQPWELPLPTADFPALNRFVAISSSQFPEGHSYVFLDRC